MYSKQKNGKSVSGRIFFVLIVLITAGLLGSCAPTQTITPAPETPTSGILPVEDKDLFRQGESFLDKGEPARALELFQSYLSENPDARNVDSVLLKIGVAHQLMDNHEESAETFELLMDKFPQSPLVYEATLGLLDAYYAQGFYEEVISGGDQLLTQPLSQGQTLRLHLLAGNALMASGYADRALDHYTFVLENVSDETSADIFARIREAVNQLTSTQAEGLLENDDVSSLTGYIYFQAGILQAADGHYEQSLDTFTRFVESYPNHELTSVAYQWLDTLYGYFSFKPYTIGCLLPLSGPYAVYGQKALRGIELALTRISSQTDLPFRLIIRDTASDPVQAVSAVRTFDEEKVAAIIGPIVTAEAAVKEAQIAKIPIITITQKDHIAETGDFVFRNFITPRMQVRSIAEYTMQSLGLRRFAIMYPRENYGTTFMNLFWDEILQQGGQIVGVEAYDPEQTDFADAIKKLTGQYFKFPEEFENRNPLLKPVAIDGDPSYTSVLGLETLFSNTVGNIMGFLKPGQAYAGRNLTPAVPLNAEEPSPTIDFDAVFIPDSPKKAAMIIPQLAFYDINDVFLLGTNLWHSSNLIQMSGQYVQGALMADGFFSQSKSPNVVAFVKDFSRIYGASPGIIEAAAFDNAMMLMDVLDNPEMLLTTEVRDALRGIESYNGVTGETAFQENGEADKKLFLLQVERRRFVEVKSFEITQ